MGTDIESKYNAIAKKYHIETDEAQKNTGKYIKEALEGFVKGKRNIAIYGAGAHTEHLLTDYVFQLRNVKIIIDNYKDKASYPGYLIIRTSEIEESGIDGVILSSFEYRHDMKAVLANEGHPIPCLDLYDYLEERGIVLGVEFYGISSPYAHYANINQLQIKIKNGKNVEYAYMELIGGFWHDGG